MNIDAIITQIRTYAPIFEDRVAGAAEYAQVEDNTWLDLPYAFVLPAGESASDNPSPNALTQYVTENFKVVVCLDNRADRRGQATVVQQNAVRTALWKALLNWRMDPERAPQGVTYDGASLIHYDKARLFYGYDFANRIMITDVDGFEPTGDDITEIDVIATTKPTDAATVNTQLHISTT